MDEMHQAVNQHNLPCRAPSHPYPTPAGLLQHPAGEGRKAWHCPVRDRLATSCVTGLVGALTETQALELRQGGRGTELVEDVVVPLCFCL